MSTNHPKAEGKTNSEVSKNYDIVGGPGRDRLFDSCKYAWDVYNKIVLHFQVVEFYTPSLVSDSPNYKPLEITNTRIFNIEHKDTSGLNFNLKGRCLARLPGDSVPLQYKFTASYNTSNRTGVISFCN